MSRSRRLAFFAAVNIDSNQFKEIEQTRGKFYFDPRIDRRFQSGSDVYASGDLDRHYLVKRYYLWGEKAENADEDIFHFTNWCPNPKRMYTRSWGDLDYNILKNAEKYGLKLSIFVGPVFRSDDIWYQGKLQIPAEFWMVFVLIKNNGNLSATGFLQTQKNLAGDLEFAYAGYKTYQVPIALIEALTGLDFLDLRLHDPLAHIQGLSGRLIERPEDIIQ
jgi:endonuclease G